MDELSKGGAIPLGAYKTARSSLSAEQLLYAVVKAIGGRIMLNEETLAMAAQGDHRVVDQVLEKEGHHYIVLATEQRML